jgi:rhodanese-related sulfurtransferase
MLLAGIAASNAAGPGSSTAFSQISRDEIELMAFIVMPETLMYRMLNNAHDFVLIDVRSEEEFRSAHIRGAVNYPWEGGAFSGNLDKLAGDKIVFIVSKDGTLALRALRLFLEHRYGESYVQFLNMRDEQPVYCIEGGMDNWPYTQFLDSE